MNPLCHRGDPLPTVEYTAEEVSTWWEWSPRYKCRWMAEDDYSAEMWWCGVVVVLKGGRFTSSCGVFTPVWPAGSSWTVCSSWRKSVATERTASLSSERFLPSWKVTKTEKLWCYERFSFSNDWKSGINQCFCSRRHRKSRIMRYFCLQKIEKVE